MKIHPVHKARNIILITLIITLLMSHPKIFLYAVLSIAFIVTVITVIKYSKGKL